MLSCPLPFTPHASRLHMAERVGFEVARAETARAPTEGASPLVSSPRGGHIPRDPPVRIPPSELSFSPTFLPLTFHASRFTSCMWRRGWDSNPRSHCWDACFPSMSIRPLSHLSTPIFARPHLSMWSDDQQVDRRGSSPIEESHDFSEQPGEITSI